MALTGKHFKAIAQVLRDERDHWNDSVFKNPEEYKARCDSLDAVAEGIADVLAQSNPNFDRHRFLEACGHHHA